MAVIIIIFIFIRSNYIYKNKTQMKTVIIYGSSTGNTEDTAEKIKEALGGETELVNAAEASVDDLNADLVILGASTWNIGDLQDDMDDFLDTLREADLSGKPVALFALGDQDGYPDTFCDGMHTVYEAVKEQGAKLIGKTATDGYEYDASLLEVDGQFAGLIIDEDCQPELTDERIANWVAQLKGEI